MIADILVYSWPVLLLVVALGIVVHVARYARKLSEADRRTRVKNAAWDRLEIARRTDDSGVLR